MMKNFGYKKDGSHWSIWNSKTYHILGSDLMFFDFYPFPTFRLSYQEDTFETDEHQFDIEFIWFCWEIRITKYWGKAYELRNKKH